MKNEIIAVGLAALVSGCDEYGTEEMGECQVGGLTLKPKYPAIPVTEDYVSIDVYENGVKVGRIAPLLVNSLDEHDGGNKKTYFFCETGEELLVSWDIIGILETK